MVAARCSHLDEQVAIQFPLSEAPKNEETRALHPGSARRSTPARMGVVPWLTAPGAGHAASPGRVTGPRSVAVFWRF